MTISDKQFHLAAIWKDREETTADLAVGLLATLDAVTGIAPYCEDWYDQDRSRPGYGLLINSIGTPNIK